MAEGLQGKGFRFVYRAGSYMWVQPSMFEQFDIDLTDCSDAEFEEFVRSRTAERVE